CLYSITITQGIFAATTCVGVWVEPDSTVRNPFYGSKGHWGVEGKCDKSKIEKEINAEKTEKTVNPITSIRMKRKEGNSLRLLRDKLGIGSLVQTKTAPTP